MPGCTATRFCPMTIVTRGAAMTILHMAFPALMPTAATGLEESPVAIPLDAVAAVGAGDPVWPSDLAALYPECALG